MWPSPAQQQAWHVGPLTTWLIGGLHRESLYSTKDISRECVNGELLILPKGELSGQYYLMALEEESSPDEIGQFIERVKNGEEELQGKSAIGRMISDFVFGFYRIFKENPIMGGLIST